MSLVRSDDYGQSKESAEVLLRTHETVRLDVDGFGSKIRDLHMVSQNMIAKEHFEQAVIISERQVKDKLILLSITCMSIYNINVVCCVGRVEIQIEI